MLPPPAPWVPGHHSTEPPGLHRDGGRATPEATCFLPGPPRHREDSHYAQFGADDQRDESTGDPTGAKKQHESGVSNNVFNL